MQRPALDTLACVPPNGQRCRLPSQDNLPGRTVDGQDRLRLLRGRMCGEACSARRGPVLFTPKIAAAQAASLIHQWDAGCGGRATARLVHVATDTGARFLRRAGRHAERFPAHRGHDVPPRALECEAQGRIVKKSSRTVRRRRVRRPVPWGLIPRWRPRGSWSSPWWVAHGPQRRRCPGATTPNAGGVPGMCQCCAPMRMAAMRRLAGRGVDVVPRHRALAAQAVYLVPGGGGHKEWQMGKCPTSIRAGARLIGWPSDRASTATLPPGSCVPPSA
jgi:hypothetical protein